jgi:hypothetical protein
MKRTVDSAGNGRYMLLYIGQTDSLRDWIPNQEKFPCVNRIGFYCICVHKDDNEYSRLAKEIDLRASNNTPYNEQ